MNKIISKLKDQKGQNLVEFALVMGLLLALVLGIVEFGRAWYTADKLKGAANIAARTYAVKQGTPAVREDAAEAAAQGVAGSGIGVTFSPVVQENRTTSIKVTVKEYFRSSAPFAPVPGGLGGNIAIFGNHTISRDATYRLEQ